MPHRIKPGPIHEVAKKPLFREWIDEVPAFFVASCILPLSRADCATVDHVVNWDLDWDS